MPTKSISKVEIIDIIHSFMRWSRAISSVFSGASKYPYFINFLSSKIEKPLRFVAWSSPRTRKLPFFFGIASNFISLYGLSLQKGHSRRIRIFFHGANTWCPSEHTNSIIVSRFLYSVEMSFQPSFSISAFMSSSCILAIHSLPLFTLDWWSRNLHYLFLYYQDSQLGKELPWELPLERVARTSRLFQLSYHYL